MENMSTELDMKMRTRHPFRYLKVVTKNEHKCSKLNKNRDLSSKSLRYY